MTRLLACLAVACIAGLAIGADLDADGVTDSYCPVADPDNSGSLLPSSLDPSTPGPLEPLLSDTILFDRAWDSGTWLNNQWDADCGYFDDDSRLDILGMHFSPNELHVFESDGLGGYRHVWAQAESLPPGSYGALCHGDPDEDGRVELLGGDVSTLGKVVLFENTGDDAWGEPHVLFRTGLRLRAIRIADTNGNDTAEIILFCGSTDGGKVQVWEHDGAPGVHTYRMLYEYTTVSYLFHGEVGDADNDGIPEMLLGIGGMHGYPMYIRRLVYDTVAHSYSHHTYESPDVVGLDLAPYAADIDTNGRNELIVGSSGETNGQVHVFKHTAGDTFERLWTSQMTTAGNAIAVGSGRFAGQALPYFFAAPFGGAVYGFVADDTACHAISYFAASGPVRSLDVSRDDVSGASCDQLLISENTSEQAVVWRVRPQSALTPSGFQIQDSRLQIAPNPFRSGVLTICHLPSDIWYPTSLSLYNSSGRLVRSFDIGHSSFDIPLGSLPSGIYTLRCGPQSARLVVLE